MATLLIVEARFYDHLNDLLLEGARAAIEEAGHRHETITVPGALEIPGAIALASESDDFDAFVALGVVIRGETYHFEIVAGESARAAPASRSRPWRPRRLCPFRSDGHGRAPGPRSRR